MKVEKVYEWFAGLDFLEQYKMTDKYFNSINPSRLTNGQVLEIYLEEKVNEPLHNVSGSAFIAKVDRENILALVDDKYKVFNKLREIGKTWKSITIEQIDKVV